MASGGPGWGLRVGSASAWGAGAPNFAELKNMKGVERTHDEHKCIGTEEQVDKLLLAKGDESPAHGARGWRAWGGSGKAYAQRCVVAVFLLLRFFGAASVRAK